MKRLVRQIQRLQLELRCRRFGLRYAPLHGWSLGYDLAAKICDQLLTRKYSRMLELGSGSSSVLWASIANREYLQEFISLEGSPTYYADTMKLLAQSGVASDRVKLLLAPYKDYVLGGSTYQFYDLTDVLGSCDLVDFLLIDGPPGNLNAMSRYPALPLLWDKLAPGCRIVLDDGARPDEGRAVRRWLEDFPMLTARYVSNSKGAWILDKP